MSELTCDKCGHQWQSRTPNPIKCPKCQKFRRGPLPALIRFKVLTRDGFTCTECDYANMDGDGLKVHHVIPQSQNGTDDLENLVTLCAPCHDQKHKSNGRTKFYRSKTLSLSDEVVAVFDEFKARGVSPNQLLMRILNIGKINPNSRVVDDSDIEEIRRRHEVVIEDQQPPARELLVELDGDDNA